MRIPVFARRSNPAIDKPILRKNLSYAEEQVDSGLAEWVDPLDRSRGVIAREMLYFGEKALPLQTVSVSDKFPSLTGGEIPGLKFVAPRTAKNDTIRRMCKLPRFREIFGDRQLEISLLA